jgi:Leucine-rich repeat (LRR) protein
MAKLKHLEELNLDGAEFEKFPTVITSLQSLESFSYEYCMCPLSEVFDSLSLLPRLKKLRFTHSASNNVDFLPESFGRLQAIEELHFYEWPDLQELPECIGNLQNLRVIDISNDDCERGEGGGGIQELPKSVSNLYNLEELDVFGLKHLNQFPPGFEWL